MRHTKENIETWEEIIKIVKKISTTEIYQFLVKRGHRVPDTMDINRPTPRYITEKFQNTGDKENIL